MIHEVLVAYAELVFGYNIKSGFMLLLNLLQCERVRTSHATEEVKFV